MHRIRTALAVVASALAMISVPTKASAGPMMTIDQASWNSTKKFVRLPNGITIAYVEVGNSKGAPLLLLHGYTDSSRSWSLVAPHLSRYRLLIPDQRGHGGSDAPECCYSLSQFAFDARLFLDALGVERAAVAGHSLGSMVAITMAAEYPDRVDSVILIGSTALVPVERGDWLYDNALALKAPLNPASQFAKDWHPANQPTPVNPAFAEAVNDEILPLPVHVWHSVMRELASTPVGRHAADVKAPVLILSGGKDPLFPAEHHRSLLATFPSAQGHVFPQLGHNPNWERPGEIAERMKAFLSPVAVEVIQKNNGPDEVDSSGPGFTEGGTRAFGGVAFHGIASPGTGLGARASPHSLSFDRVAHPRKKKAARQLEGAGPPSGVGPSVSSRAARDIGESLRPAFSR